MPGPAREKSDPPPVRVVVIDDHALVREAVCTAIMEDARFECAGDAADGAAGLALLGQTRPDVAVLDLSMPRVTGVELLSQARQATPETRFVLLTGAPLDGAERAQLEPLFEALMHKEESMDGLLEEIAKAAAGPLRPAQPPTEQSGAKGLLAADTLTAREREVLREIGRGRSVDEIARQLECSAGTVRKHRQNMLDKLALNSTTQLVRLALQVGGG